MSRVVPRLDSNWKSFYLPKLLQGISDNQLPIASLSIDHHHAEVFPSRTACSRGARWATTAWPASRWCSSATSCTTSSTTISPPDSSSSSRGSHSSSPQRSSRVRKVSAEIGQKAFPRLCTFEKFRPLYFLQGGRSKVSL